MNYWWLGGALAALVLLFLWIFNTFVGLKNRAEAAFSDIDTQLKKRYDLIPQLVSVVQGYAKHEKDLLTRVTELRAQAMLTETVTERAKLEQNIGSLLNNIFILSEQYPDLKAAPQFTSLHASLVSVEDGISHARRYYNAVVRDYNSLRGSFPQMFVAALGGFRPLPFFVIDDKERSAPSVTTL